MKAMKCKICGKGFSPSDDSLEARGAALARLNKHRRKEHPNAKSAEKKGKPASKGVSEFLERSGYKFCPTCGKVI